MEQKGAMRQRGQVLEQTADADLAARATVGELDAFEELYRRHVEAAWRMALAVTANPHDAADAVSDAFTRVFQALPDRPQAAGHFLPYLLASVRNAAIDGLRRGGRQRATDFGEHPDWATVGAEPADQLVADVDTTLVARAFRSLPERWRSVLWLTEVENIPAREVAGLLGISPNGVAQLAMRARAGLRQRYLQAHLGHTDVRNHCRGTVDRLGAYAAGALAPRDISKVDQHLAGCDACRSRLSQLQDVTPCLHRAVLPLPAALAALSAGKWHLASGGTAAATTTAGAAAPAGIGLGVVAAALPTPFLATVATAAVLVAGFIGAGVVERRQNRAPPAPVTAVGAPSAEGALTAASAPPGARGGSGADGVGGLLQEAARVGADLATVTDLLAGLAGDVARLPTPGPDDLAAITRGGVRVDTDPAAPGVDVSDGRHPCPSFRVLGVHLGCQGVPPIVVVAPGPSVPEAGIAAIVAPDGALAPPAGNVTPPATGVPGS